MCVGSMYQMFLFRDSDIGINICDHDVWRNIYTYGGTFILMEEHLSCVLVQWQVILCVA